MARIVRQWRRYKYRFVPWIASDFNRQIELSGLSREDYVDSTRAKQQLLRVVSALHRLRRDNVSSLTGSQVKRL